MMVKNDEEGEGIQMDLILGQDNADYPVQSYLLPTLPSSGDLSPKVSIRDSVESFR